MSTGSEIFVPTRAAQQALVPARPITNEQLYVLFAALLRNRAYFQAVRERLRPDYFDDIHEAHWQLLLLGLMRAYDNYDGASYMTICAACMDEMRENPNVRLNDDQAHGLFSEQSEQPGAIVYIYSLRDDQIGPDTVAMASEVLHRFLFERGVVAPLRRIMSSGFSTPGAYPEGLDGYLEDLVTQQRRMAAPDTLPTVMLAPPPGELLRPACAFVPTGLNMFDERFNGQRRGDVNGIIGVTGGAKTTLMIYMAVRAAQLSWLEGHDRCEQVAYFTYEEPVWRLRPRFQSAAMYIPRETLEVLTDANQLARTPQDYERGLAPDSPSEYDRYCSNSNWLNQTVVAFDLSGSDAHPMAGQGYVPEISAILDQWAQRTGRGFRSVFVDYAGLSCDRFMAAMSYDESKLRHLLRSFGNECKKSIAEKFNCTTWVAQQIRGDACNKNPTALLHHNDASESKSFGENMALCGCIGSADRQSGCRVLNFSKVRYKAQERVPPVTFRINERFAIIDDMTNAMVADASGSHFVNREDAERVQGRETRAQSGPPGLRRVVDPLSAYDTGQT